MDLIFLKLHTALNPKDHKTPEIVLITINISNIKFFIENMSKDYYGETIIVTDVENHNNDLYIIETCEEIEERLKQIGIQVVDFGK